jgi:hypothetical protein
MTETKYEKMIRDYLFNHVKNHGDETKSLRDNLFKGLSYLLQEKYGSLEEFGFEFVYAFFNEFRRIEGLKVIKPVDIYKELNKVLLYWSKDQITELIKYLEEVRLFK